MRRARGEPLLSSAKVGSQISPQQSLLRCRTTSKYVLDGNAKPLFVFSIGSREQNGVSLLTPVSDSVFIALSDGTFLFSLHGSFKNHQLKDL